MNHIKSFFHLEHDIIHTINALTKWELRRGLKLFPRLLTALSLSRLMVSTIMVALNHCNHKLKTWCEYTH